MPMAVEIAAGAFFSCQLGDVHQFALGDALNHLLMPLM